MTTEAYNLAPGHYIGTISAFAEAFDRTTREHICSYLVKLAQGDVMVRYRDTAAPHTYILGEVVLVYVSVHTPAVNTARRVSLSPMVEPDAFADDDSPTMTWEGSLTGLIRAQRAQLTYGPQDATAATFTGEG